MHVNDRKHLPGVIVYVFHGGFVCAFSFLMFDKCFPGYFTANLVLFTYDVVINRGLNADSIMKLYAVVLAFAGGGAGGLLMAKYKRRNLLAYQSLWRMAAFETAMMAVFASCSAVYQYFGAPQSDWLIFFLGTGAFISGGWQFQSVSSWNSVPFRSNMMSGNMYALSASLFKAIWLRLTGQHLDTPDEFNNEVYRAKVIFGFALVFISGSAVGFVLTPLLKFYCGIISVITCALATVAGILSDR